MPTRKSKPSSNEKQASIDSGYAGEPVPSVGADFIQAVSGAVHHTSDLVVKKMPPTLTLIYIDSLVDTMALMKHVLNDLVKQPIDSPQTIVSNVTVSKVKTIEKMGEAIQAMMGGAVLIHVEGYAEVNAAMIPTSDARQISATENESQVIGAQAAFNESLSTNVSLIRRYIRNTKQIGRA